MNHGSRIQKRGAQNRRRTPEHRAHARMRVSGGRIAKALFTVVIALGCVVIIIVRNWDDFKAESAGKRNRKFGAADSADSAESVAGRAGDVERLEQQELEQQELEQQLEQLLRSAVGPIDVHGLMHACGMDRTGGTEPSEAPMRVSSAGSLTGCRRHPVDPRVYVLGERHSGTNIAASLAYSNFDLDMEPASKVRSALARGMTDSIDETVRKEYVGFEFAGMKPQSASTARFSLDSFSLDSSMYVFRFGINNHKHNLQHDDGVTSYGGLSILCVRNPYDWVRAMRDECYFCEGRNRNAKSLAHFLSTPWTGGAHIEKRYQNIFDLRYQKVCNWLSVAVSRSNCVMVVRAEELVLQKTQRAFVSAIEKLTGWQTADASIHTSGATNVGRSRDERFDISGYFRSSALFSSIAANDTFRANGREVAAGSTGPLIDAIHASAMNPSFEHALGYILT
jgi:hypothetical protein